MDGSCIAGSVTDTVMCESQGTPKPLTVKWFKERTGADGVDEMIGGENSDLLGAETRLSCPSCVKGHVMGRQKMPLFGAKWLVQFYAAWPDYDSRQPTDEPAHTFPKQGYGRQVDDKITATMNGVVIDMPPPVDSRGRVKLGKMAFFTHEFEGDELAYRFDFASTTTEILARPFIVGGEVTLLRDATTGDAGTGAASSNGGKIAGRVLDAIDGKKISTVKAANDGQLLCPSPECHICTILPLLPVLMLHVLLSDSCTYRLRQERVDCHGKHQVFDLQSQSTCCPGKSHPMLL